MARLGRQFWSLCHHTVIRPEGGGITYVIRCILELLSPRSLSFWGQLPIYIWSFCHEKKTDLEASITRLLFRENWTYYIWSLVSSDCDLGKIKHIFGASLTRLSFGENYILYFRASSPDFLSSGKITRIKFLGASVTRLSFVKNYT